MKLHESLYFSIFVNGLSGGISLNTCMLAEAARRNGSDTIEVEVFKRLHECLIVCIIYNIIYNLQIFTIYTTTAATSQWRGRVTHIQLVVITSEMIATYASTSMLSPTIEYL